MVSAGGINAATVDLDFAGKGEGKGKASQFGGNGVMNPMQMTMAAINAMKGGGKGYSNANSGITKEGIKGGKDSGRGCYNCGEAGHMA